jgi:very-short-patch-repair endonuclease
MSDLDRRLAALAARQHQLITTADVVAAGGAQHHADTRVSGGRWQRLDRGVFVINGAPLDWPTRQHAAVLAAGEGAVTSHLAAARLLGLPGFGGAGLEVTVPRGVRFRRNGVRVHESTDLDRCRVVRRDGIPLTDADRTLLDLGRYLGQQRLTRVIESARRADLVTWSSLIATLARHARRGRAGTRRLRAVILAGAQRAEVTDTDVELLLYGMLVEAGLPPPTIRHRVYDDDRFVAEIDLSFPALKVAIEVDGEVHLLEEVHERDLPRQNELVLLGWTVLRFSNERVLARPVSVVAQVVAAVEAARRGEVSPSG